jgi:hypothetical protein
MKKQKKVEKEELDQDDIPIIRWEDGTIHDWGIMRPLYKLINNKFSSNEELRQDIVNLLDEFDKECAEEEKRKKKNE